MSEQNEVPTESESTAVARPARLLLTKAHIKAARDIEFYEVHVPEWAPEGTDPEQAYVVCKTMTGKERDAFEASLIQGAGRAQRIDMNNVRGKFCSLIIVDPETRQRMFGREEIDELAARSSVALNRVYDEGMKRSKFSEQDMQELVGNSAADQPV
jgi:hypothetical protein